MSLHSSCSSIFVFIRAPGPHPNRDARRYDPPKSRDAASVDDEDRINYTASHTFAHEHNACVKAGSRGAPRSLEGEADKLRRRSQEMRDGEVT